MTLKTTDAAALEGPQKKRILVAFGDISGFSNWSRRTEDDGEHFLRLMRPLGLVFSAVRDDKTTVKKYADGLMMVIEIEHGKEEQAALKMLHKCVTVLKHTDRIIRNLHHPKPTGFRIRLIAGPAWKWMDPGEEWDYYSKTVNTAKNLLGIAKSIPFIAHATFLELIHPKALKRIGINVTPLAPQESVLDNLDKEDLSLLFCLKIKRCVGCRICFSKTRRMKRKP